ncbi:MAG: methyltransferase domain-containing protein, partial [Pseudomonadota bacterium]
MASMDYDEAAAERLETVYRGTDMAAQRRFTLAQLALSPGERVIDIGSGPGFLAAEMAEAVGPAGAVLGVDISEALLARARARNAHAWLSYAWGDATALPTPDAAFDVAVSVQVAEYVADTEGFCAELARVLRPGGRGLVVATDWD